MGRLLLGLGGGLCEIQDVHIHLRIHTYLSIYLSITNERTMLYSMMLSRTLPVDSTNSSAPPSDQAVPPEKCEPKTSTCRGWRLGAWFWGGFVCYLFLWRVCMDGGMHWASGRNLGSCLVGDCGGVDGVRPHPEQILGRRTHLGLVRLDGRAGGGGVVEEVGPLDRQVRVGRVDGTA